MMDKRYRYTGFGILLILALTGTGYVAVKKIAENPCDIPKTWSVGAVDRRFSITKETIEKYTSDAAESWNKAYPKQELLSHAKEGGDIVINFVYDERQRTTTQNEKLKQAINEEKTELDSIKQTLESLKDDYKTLEVTIKARTDAYTSHLASHNSEVTYWNERGGAPNSEYQRLRQDGMDLEIERTAINRDINRYNSLAVQIQNYGKSHNEVVENLNHKIELLNEGAVREFEEGTYDPSTQEITIYEYSDETALRRVLTHELGHAIGLKHVEEKGAIMYPVNEGENLTLEDADKDELSRVCREKTPEDVMKMVRATRDDIVRLAKSSLLGTAAQEQ